MLFATHPAHRKGVNVVSHDWMIEETDNDE
jgi:hypothetical protein